MDLRKKINVGQTDPTCHLYPPISRLAGKARVAIVGEEALTEAVSVRLLATANGRERRMAQASHVPGEPPWLVVLPADRFRGFPDRRALVEELETVSPPANERWS
jgi:hypothetical protein